MSRRVRRVLWLGLALGVAVAPSAPAQETPAAEPPPAASEPAAPDAAEAARRRAERAERRANQAERLAREALARVEALEERLAFDRTGVYVGASGFWAPEVFDEASRVIVNSGWGASARIGYRLHPHVAVDLRYDYLDGFDVRFDDVTGEIDGHAITANVRAFVFPDRFQPWLGVGIGGIVTDFDARRSDGRKADTFGTETDPVFRFGAGLDTYLSPNLVLTLEAAMSVVTDDRDAVNYGQLGVGLDFRF